MKRIVVGTDLSRRSEAAVRIAADLAGQLGSTLHIVHAYAAALPSMQGEFIPPISTQQLEGDLEREVVAFAAQFEGRGLSVETHVCAGTPADAICRVADTVEADLIVVGNKRMKGAARAIGSVPNKVAHRADCSVMIAKTG